MRYDNGKEIVWNSRIHGGSVFIDVVGPPHPLIFNKLWNTALIQ